MQRQYLQHAHKTTPDEGGETASPQTGKNPQIYPDDSALCRNSGRNRRIDKLLKVPASTAEASTPMEAIDMAQQVGKGTENTMGTRIQGLSAETYAAHPDWTEDFLTVNEYSRPGDPLTEVNNIFVHYTANPRHQCGTEPQLFRTA